MPYGEGFDQGPEPRATQIHIDTTPPVPGAWCPHCLLPAGYAVTLTELDDDGVMLIGTVVYCPTCDQWTQQRDGG